VVLLVVVAAVLGPALAPHDPIAPVITKRFRPPGWTSGDWTHPLGTDALGRDILSRIIAGSRISLVVGVTAVASSGTIGVIAGLLAGFYGGWIDDAIMRVADIQLSIPFIVLAVAMAAVLGGSLRSIIIILTITGWVLYARIVRSEVLSVKEREFVQAAHAIGTHNPRLIAVHIFPNIRSSIIVVATLEVARMIIAEASLSFLGLGVPPAIPTWGGMIADSRVYLSVAWWAATFPGLAIFCTVLGVNLLGDWLRVTLDPGQLAQ
jgi:peptide/nickel transport system permease protein